MAVKFFGQFLIERGAISRDALLRAIELQDSVNLKFGEMALAMNLITPADVDRVHEAQKAEDLMFGDLSVKLGILSTDQMKQVLTMQKNSHLYIGEALVHVGALDKDQLQHLLDDFKVDQAPYATAYVFVPQGVAHSGIWEMAADISGKMIARVANLPCRLGECRRVDRLDMNDVVGMMDFKGDVNASYLLSVSTLVRKKIALALLKESNVDAEPEDVLDDALMELVNVVCGNVVAKAAQQGKSMEIEPPVILRPGPEGIMVPSGQEGIVFPIHLANEEKVELAIFMTV